MYDLQQQGVSKLFKFKRIEFFWKQKEQAKPKR